MSCPRAGGVQYVMHGGQCVDPRTIGAAGFDVGGPTLGLPTSINPWNPLAQNPLTGGTGSPGVPIAPGADSSVCQLLGLPQAVCDVGSDVYDALAGSGNGNGNGQATTGGTIDAPTTNGCAPGFIRDQSGICVHPGSPGDVSTNPNQGYTPVSGAFGMAAYAPKVVGTRQRKDGSSSPILQCPTKYALGVDNLCYAKAQVRRNSRWRKWRSRAPLLTGGQRNILTKADSIRRELADAGYGECASGGSRRRKSSGSGRKRRRDAKGRFV